MITYIHYGADNFVPGCFAPIRNIEGFLPKPEGGLWASREDDSFGWKVWCEDNHFAAGLWKKKESCANDMGG